MADTDRTTAGEVADDSGEFTVRQARLIPPLPTSELTAPVAPAADDEFDAPPGYVLLREVGRGGMGVVYEAEEVALGRRVALKFLRAQSADPNAVARFRAEAAAAARLQHPGIVQIYRHGVWRGRPYIAQEFVAGGGLDLRLAKSLPDAPTAAALAVALARAVQAAHAAGIVHRDLKPANVLLAGGATPRDAESRGTATTPLAGAVPKITDFGLAKHGEDDGIDTQTGAVLGTPSYMAPEQAEGRHDVGPPADVYALGVILYECLTGRPPFKAATMLDTLQLVRNAEPHSPRRLQPTVPRDLETVTLKCLRKEPGRRYGTAADLADDLERFLSGRPVKARPVGAVARALKWARRRPAAAALVAVLVLGVCGGIVGALIHESQLRSALAQTQQEKDRADDNYNQTKREKERAGGNYRAARDTIRRMLERYAGKQGLELPGFLELKREQQEEALRFFATVIGEQDDPNPDVREDVALAFLATADIQLQMGRRAEAQASYRRALALFEGLAADFPEHLRFRLEQAACLNNFSVASTDAAEMERLQREALDIREDLIRAEPDNPEFRFALAMSLHNRGQRHYAGGRRSEAAVDLRRAADLRAGPPPAGTSPGVAATTARHRAEDLLMLALALTGAEGEAAFREAESILQDLQGSSQEVEEVACDLAAVETNWGLMLGGWGELAAALTRFTRAIAVVDPVVKREPNLERARGTLLNAHGGRAQTLERLGRFREAADDRQRVVDLADPKDRPKHRLFLAMARARAGDHREAAAEADAVAELPDAANGEWSMFLAGVFARCAKAAEGDSVLERRYGDRALFFLIRAKLLDPERWKKSRPKIEEDEDLAPLRGRPDFQELMRAK